jgi:linoleoyl-CoA desaturase
LVIVVSAPNWWLQIFGLTLVTVGSIGIGTNTHTSSHFATSERRWVNQALTFFGYPLCFGLSATHWWRKHVFRHHSGPNMKGIDGDFDLYPWFAGTIDEVRRSNGLRRIYYQHLQGFVFPFAIGLTLIVQQANGLSQLLRALGNAELRRWEHWVDMCALLAHAIICLVVPAFFFPARDVIAFYLVRNILNSYAMFMVFAPAHMPAAAARLNAEPSRLGEPLAHTSTTLNFKTGRTGAWICGGLQYQIEHHLVPDISHVHYRQVSTLVREFCRQQGLPYQCYGWGRAIALSLLSIRHPRPTEDLDSVERRQAERGGEQTAVK